MTTTVATAAPANLQFPTQAAPAQAAPVIPPAAPAAHGNGEPLIMKGDVVGMKPPALNADGTPVVTATAAAAPAAGDMTAVIALLAQTLKGTGATPAAGQTPAEAAAAAIAGARPAWLGDVNTFDLSKVQDPIIKSMGNILQTVGKDLDLDRVLGRALAEGDVTLIDAAYVGEKGGQNAAQILEIAKGLVQQVAAKSQAVTSKVHATAGGEQQFSLAMQVFNQSAPAELKMLTKMMLDSPDENMILNGAKLVAEFGKASGSIPQQGAALLNTGATGAYGLQGLSKAQFQSELGKLNRNAPDYQEQRDILYSRRAVGKRTNMA